MVDFEYGNNSKSVEFEGVKNQAVTNRFILSLKHWVCRSNLENLNAAFISEEYEQTGRLKN